jgi:hypothetical protein
MDTPVTDVIEEAKAEARAAFPELTSEETAWLTIAGYNLAMNEIVPDEFLPVLLRAAGDHMKAVHQRFEAERAASS